MRQIHFTHFNLSLSCAEGTCSDSNISQALSVRIDLAERQTRRPLMTHSTEAQRHRGGAESGAMLLHRGGQDVWPQSYR